MKIAVVLVHYHAAELTQEAYEALDADLRATEIEAHWMIVDNGSTAQERALLASLPPQLLEPGANLGYAGGVNLGAKEMGDADVLWVMNPDVIVRPGCAQALCGELERGTAVVGPRFFWDRAATFLLPPSEERTRTAEILAVLARRGDPWARLGRRRWRRRARRVWTAQTPVSCWELSGALLAIRRDAWERVGPFDEAYQLYFEETDWLERARKAGLQARCIPDAEAVHLYARSTLREPRAEGWFVESSRRFRRRHYGEFFTSWLERLDRWWTPAEKPPLPPPSEVTETSDASRADATGAEAWLEIAPWPSGYPAAACPPGKEAALPEEELPPGSYVLRSLKGRDRRLHRPPASGR